MDNTDIINEWTQLYSSLRNERIVDLKLSLTRKKEEFNEKKLKTQSKKEELTTNFDHKKNDADTLLKVFDDVIKKAKILREDIENGNINNDNIYNAEAARKNLVEYLSKNKSLENQINNNYMMYKEKYREKESEIIINKIRSGDLNGAIKTKISNLSYGNISDKDFTKALEVVLMIQNAEFDSIKSDYKARVKVFEKENKLNLENYLESIKSLMEDTAKHLTTDLIKISDEIKNEDISSQIEKTIYKALFQIETKTKFDKTKLLSLNENEVKNCLDKLVGKNEITAGDGFNLFLKLYDYTSHTHQEEELQENHQQKGNGEKMRKVALYKILGDARAAITLAKKTPVLGFSREGFEIYSKKLKEIKTILVNNGEYDYINPKTNPAMFGNLKSMESLEEEIKRDDIMQNLNQDLAKEGYDSEFVHAFISAFRPGTFNFIGSHKIGERSVLKNIRPYLSQEKLGQADKELKILVKAGLIDNNDGYSLTAHRDNIKDRSLKRTLEYYLNIVH
ncbi:MAG TPA: hypothetical protein VJB94_01430 [Candidatus Nanoarchaeia archaeon]|nr:hypothetical protein [Candidatus Nanoarchaeia archaeon]